MKTTLVMLALLPTLLPLRSSSAQETPSAGAQTGRAATAARNPANAAAEAKFKQMLTNATLSGRWATLKEGELGDEKQGDKYKIVSVTKGDGNHWVINARMKYQDREVDLPIPAQVRFAGGAAILILDKFEIPNGSTYSARVLFYEDTYSGYWSAANGNKGMLYGVISH